MAVSSVSSPAYLDILSEITVCSSGMLAAKRYRTRSSARATRSRAPQGEIHHFFQSAHHTSPGSTSWLRPRTFSNAGLTCIFLCTRPTRDSCTLLHEHVRDDKLPAPFPEFLQALPTKQDIEALILRVEETHRRDIQAVRAEVHSLSEQVDAGET